VASSGESTTEPYSFSLSSDQLNEVSRVLHNGNPTQLYSEKFGYRIYLRDLRTLCDRSWLNDNVNLLVLSYRRSSIVPFSSQKRRHRTVASPHLSHL